MRSRTIAIGGSIAALAFGAAPVAAMAAPGSHRSGVVATRSDTSRDKGVKDASRDKGGKDTSRDVSSQDRTSPDRVDR